MSGLDIKAPFDPKFMARLEKLRLCSRRIFSGRMNAGHISKKLGSGMEFADHRGYTPGDDLRLLDWNVYGRSEKLYTKLYRQEEDRNLFFLVDVSGSMGVEQEKFDFARKLAAAVAYIGLYEMDRIFLMGFSDGITVSRPVLRGRQSVFEALHFLSQLKSSGRTNFAKLGQDFTHMHGAKEGMVLIFSDFIDLEGVGSALDSMFSQGFEVLALQLVTPAELNPKLLGEWRLANPEEGRPYTVHFTRRTLARYRQAIREHGDLLRRHILARRGGFVRALTSTSLEDLVLKELRAGNLLA